MSLIDLSPGGAQIETTARFQPGSDIVIEIAGQEGDVAVPARVLRCQVSRLAPHAIYRGAILFKRPFELPDEPARVSLKDGDCNPVHECARLSLALKRFAEPNRAGLITVASGAGKAWTEALGTVQGMIESASGRRAGTPYRQEMSRLLRTLIRCVESGVTPDVFSAELVERVRRAVPVLTLRVVDAGAALKIRGAAIFDMPATQHRKAARLVVELPLGCRLEEWHQEFLRAVAQLMAVTQDIEPTVQPEPEPEADRTAAADAPGWNRLVVRYADGRMMKGFSRNFMPSKGQIDVWPVPDGPAASRITVPLTHLKAAFFVHDLAGLPEHVGPSPFEADLRAGRRIVVTFIDGEVMAGTTLNYSPGGAGFFMVPADDRTNNLRVFVVSGAIRHVQFP